MRCSLSALILLASLLVVGCHTAQPDAATSATPKNKKPLCCPATACAPKVEDKSK